MISKKPWQQNEQGFLIVIALLSVVSIFYIFQDFLLPMTFSCIIACATYPFYKKLKNKFDLSSNKSAGIFTFIITMFLIIPFTYIISIIGFEAKNLYVENQDLAKNLNFEILDSVYPYIIEYTSLNEENIVHIKEFISENKKTSIEFFKTKILTLSKVFISGSLNTLLFFIISIFSLFFFYRDGKHFSKKIKIISPLDDYYDDILLKDIASISGVLFFSVFIISFLQGLSFAFVSMFFDLNWLFIGIAVMLAGFVPVFGSALVWIPLAIYLLGVGSWEQALFVVFWGSIVVAILIDNILRPYVLSYIYKQFKDDNSHRNKSSPLDNTFIVIMSTFGGVSIFGIIGLFIGPIMAALAVSVIDIYILRVENLKKD